MKIKLVNHQIKHIKVILDFSDSRVEDMILDRYAAPQVESLNATDYESIIDDIHGFNNEMKSAARGY